MVAFVFGKAMRPAKAISQEEIEILEAKASSIKGRREYCRLQSVLLRAKDNKSPEAIGEILGLHPRTVQKHHQRYFKEGLAAFEAKKTGTTGPRLLKPEEEAALFERLKAEAAEGELVNVCKIKALFEQKTGKPCARSTIYVVIHRNNWSKKQPRPRHPRGCEEAKDLFKKTP